MPSFPINGNFAFSDLDFGSYFYFDEENVAQGRAGFIETLKENSELYNKISDRFYEVI